MCFPSKTVIYFFFFSLILFSIGLRFDGHISMNHDIMNNVSFFFYTWKGMCARIQYTYNSFFRLILLPLGYNNSAGLWFSQTKLMQCAKEWRQNELTRLLIICNKTQTRNVIDGDLKSNTCKWLVLFGQHNSHATKSRHCPQTSQRICTN